MERKRCLIQGVGVNDADYVTQRQEKQPNGKWKQVGYCPYYRRWVTMIARCYSEKRLERFPTYKDCSVHSDWLLFSNFRSWMVEQDWKGKDLDKDILIKGNKVYSEEACIFVSKEVNYLLTDSSASRGEYLIGVSWHKKDGKFRSKIKIKGKSCHLGGFTSETSAHRVYCIAKNEEINRIAEEQTNPRLKEALLSHMYTQDYINDLQSQED